MIYITVPCMRNIFLLSLVNGIRGTLMMMELPLLMTNGGPNNATEMFAMNIYNEIFKLNNYGYGQAKAILFLIVVATFTLLQVAITKRKEVQM